MSLASHFLTGIAFAFSIWTLMFIAGTSATIILAGPIIDDRIQRRTDTEALEVLASTACGVGITIFSLFLIAAAHAFNAPTIVVIESLILVSLVLGAFRRASSKQLIAQLRRAGSLLRSPSWVVSFLASVILAPPALLPPSLFDDTMYHLAYAVDWANAGGLVVDRFLRFPLAQFNIELLYAMCFALHLGPYVEFITWLFFAIATTGIASITTYLIKALDGRLVFAESAGLLTSLVFISCPVVLRFYAVAYVDVPAGAMLLSFAAAAFLAISDFRRYKFAMAIVAGAFVGIKLSFAPLLFVFLLFIVLMGKNARARKREIVACTLLLAVFASPWFLRNAIISGDPIDPILNLALHHPDLFWSQADIVGQKNDLFTETPAIAIPLRMFFDRSFAGDSVSASFLLLYLPIAIGIALAFNRRWRSAFPEYTIVATLVVFAEFSEALVTNRIARYTLHFYPLFLILVAVSVWIVVPRIFAFARKVDVQLAPLVSLIVISLLAIPSPGSKVYYDLIRDQIYESASASDNPESYLDRVSGYREAVSLASIVVASKTRATVFTPGFPNLAYYFREHKVISLGDWFGPGRLSDVSSALDRKSFSNYVTQFGIGAVMISRSFGTFNSAEMENLYNGLRQADFREISDRQSEIRTFANREVLLGADRYGNLKVASRDISPEMPSPLASPISSRSPALIAGSVSAPTKAATCSDRGSASMNFTSKSLKNARFTAQPDPVEFCGTNSYATLTVNWVASGATRIEIHMQASDGVLFAAGGATGTAITGEWVNPKSVFYLQDVSEGEPGKTLAILSGSICKACLRE